MARRPYHLLSLMALPLAGVAFLSTGCSSEANHDSSVAAPGGDQTFHPAPVGTAGGACSTPDEGCACNEEGATDECAEKLYQEGEYIQCIHGTRTCANQVWGACVTKDGQVSTMKAPDAQPGYQIEGLGGSQKCINNPCNPYCNSYQDTPAGLDAGADSGLQIDGGLTLAPNPYWKPVNITSFRIAPKPSMTITVTSIPQGQYPGTSPTPAQFTAEFLCNTPAVPCNPPKPTAASWSLSDYSTALVGTDGTVSVIKPIPKTFVITGSAGGYSDTATINVVVNAMDAPGVPANVVATLANTPGTVQDDAAILYPYKNSLFPRGMTAPVLQWSGSTTTSFVKYSLRHKNAAGVYDFTWSKITTEPSPQRAYFPQNVWAQFDETASGGNAEIVLQRAAVTCNKPAAAASCSDYSYAATNYRFCTLGYNWSQARSSCQSMGMDLVKIADGGENAFVSNVANNIASGSWWIGANDQAVEGTFRWPDGTPLTYTNWNPGEPNDWGGAEDCGELYTAAQQWNDNNCGVGRYFVCEAAATGCAVGQVDKEIVLPIRFSSEPMQGSVFFWEINNGRIAKILDDGTLVQNFIQNAGRCMACHSVSSDGGTLVAQADGGNQHGITYNAITGAKIFELNNPSQFMAISPTGKWMIWGDAGNLSLSNSGTIVKTIPSTNNGNVAPAWSPLGNYIAYAVRYTGSWYVDFYGSNLWRTTFSDPPVGGNYFSNTHQIVSGFGTWPVVAYPTFSPDESYLVFQRANALRTRNNLGQLWISDNNGGGARELVTADTATYMTANGTVLPARSGDDDTQVNYEPTFSPTTSGGYYWLVFISNRDYGNFSYSPSPLRNNGRKQMWVSAITANPGSSGDPSNPPVWLPGQDVNNQNMRGAFSKTACRNVSNACKWDEDCCGFAGGTAKCVLDQPVTPAATRHCGAFTPGQCVENGGACTNGTQCCKNPKVLECIQGICSEPVPTPFYTPATFTRDYEGTCPQGYHVIWRLFSWKGVTPGDSSIAVSAQTGLQISDLAAAPSASLTPLLPAQCTAGYACGDVKVALDALPSVSKQFLRVSMLLNPTSDNATPPTVSDWKQDYDCVPSELSA